MGKRTTTNSIQLAELLLRDRCLSLRDIAQTIGRTPRTLRNWAAGITHPSRPDIEALARALNIPSEQLISTVSFAIFEGKP